MSGIAVATARHFAMPAAFLAREAEIEREAKSRLERPGVAVATVAGKLEMELAQMPLDEER
ncbi:MAG: hypothetical protein FJ318_10095, partial [SAR202 cluster bacterium]|nr:hypothetical protein [SAR202 cluster bacterium]